MAKNTVHSAPIVALTDIGLSYDGSAVLEKISLELFAGEITVILAPSGAGKTTLLNIIAGLIAADVGTVSTSAKNAGEIGYVFQDPNLMGWANVIDNVALPLELMGNDKERAQKIAHKWLVQTGLGQSGWLYPAALSGGMKMRASLARAFSTAPTLLCLDEPFAAIDEIGRRALGFLLLEMVATSEKRPSIVLVTHSVEEAAFLADNLVILSARPAHIIETIEVKKLRGKIDHQSFLHSPPFFELCTRVRQWLN